MLNNIIQTLQQTYGLTLVGHVGVHKEVGDIDFHAFALDTGPVREYLLEQGFVIRENPGRGFLAARFIEGEFYLIDIARKCDFFLGLFPRATFTTSFNKEVGNDPKLETFFRYVLPLRPQQKYRDFVRAHFATYGHYLWDGAYIENTPFRSNVSCDTLLGAMQKRPLALLRTYTLRALLLLVWQLVLVRWRKINSGRIIAFVGSDGSGKTTAIEKMHYALDVAKPTRVQYMGDYWFVLQPFYIWLHQQHIYVARLSYPFFYIENWCRYIMIRYWKFRGRIVLTDRWPGLNRHLRKPGRLLKLNDWMYTLYPEPDGYIFLSADPETVHARRQELSVAEISTLQGHMRERLAKKRLSYEAVNDDLDECLNGILAYIYKEFSV